MGPPLAGDWSVDEGVGLREMASHPAQYPPPPESGAPGKVSASARDSPWPLPSPRSPEL